tara:strand:+ start:133 stop:783 length:651 start_codon:yes stop_codon:yes gene_type:complete
MTVKRTKREEMLRLIENNPGWNVLELGCAKSGWTCASVYADIENYEEHYKKQNKSFVQTQADDTPFEDGQYDFVIACHITEHMTDPKKFFNELSRIAKRGYIEVPTPFFDNFILGNSNPLPHGHCWWITFDDVKNEIIFKPRYQVVKESIHPKDTTFLMPFFRDSMITCLYWENKIDFRIDDPIFSYEAGNGDPVQEINLTNKKIPPHMQWRVRIR